MAHRFFSTGKQRKQKSSKEKLKELMEFAGVSERSKVVDITRKVRFLNISPEFEIWIIFIQPPRNIILLILRFNKSVL